MPTRYEVVMIRKMTTPREAISKSAMRKTVNHSLYSTFQKLFFRARCKGILSRLACWRVFCVGANGVPVGDQGTRLPCERVSPISNMVFVHRARFTAELFRHSHCAAF